jgi:hypothetical protein
MVRQKDNTSYQADLEKMDLQVSEDGLPSLIALPKIRWRSEFWLALIPFVLGGLGIFLPQCPKILAILLLLAPLYLPIVEYAYNLGKVGIQRVKHYPKTHLIAQQAIKDAGNCRIQYAQLAMKSDEMKIFEITEATYNQFTEMCLSLKKKRSPAVTHGDRFVVVDMSDQYLMGTFGVVDIQSQTIYVKAVEQLDPVWAGYVKASTRMTSFPNMRAILVTQGDVK